MKRVLTLLLWFSTAQSTLAATDAPAAARPNLVFIMADDLGWRGVAPATRALGYRVRPFQGPEASQMQTAREIPGLFLILCC